jgi:glycosyltransferase A (GT-A) superfamily protein (DUF2064 family)
MPADRVLIFGERPLPGAVKTRLSPPLPPEEAAAVYDACLRDVIALAARERGRVELWYEGNSAHKYFSREFPHLTCASQSGGSLGARLTDAFVRSFDDGAERVIIIPNDAPTLPDTVLTSAFHDLQEADIVIGPNHEGSCYLIGLRSAAWPQAALMLNDIPNPEGDTFNRILAQAATTDLDLRVLPGWYGIEVPEDLMRARADAAAESHLGRWLDSDSARQLLGS